MCSRFGVRCAEMHPELAMDKASATEKRNTCQMFALRSVFAGKLICKIGLGLSETAEIKSLNRWFPATIYQAGDKTGAKTVVDVNHADI